MLHSTSDFHSLPTSTPPKRARKQREQKQREEEKGEALPQKFDPNPALPQASPASSALAGPVSLHASNITVQFHGDVDQQLQPQQKFAFTWNRAVHVFVLFWLISVTIILAVALKINVTQCEPWSVRNPTNAYIPGVLSSSQSIGASTVFNFSAHMTDGETCGQWGCAIPANNQNWPDTINQQISQTLFILEPNGANLPHHHPDGVEVLHVFEGMIEVYRIEPNSGGPTKPPHRFVMNPGMSVIFPRGHFHFQHNVGMGRARYISTLNSENAGVNTLGVRTCQLPRDVLLSAFGLTTGAEIDKMCMNLPPASFPGKYIHADRR